MKKSLVLALVVVYVLSICVVGYFGLNVRVYRPTVYPESIVITKVIDNYGNEVPIKENKTDNSKYVRLSGYEEGYSLTIIYQFAPNETTKRRVYFTESVDGVCEVYQDSELVISQAQIIFKQNHIVTITVKSVDTPTTYDSLTIDFKN